MPRKRSESRSSPTVKTNFSPARGFFWAARTPILLWYLPTIGFIFVVSIPAFRQVFSERVNRELTQAVMNLIQNAIQHTKENDIIGIDSAISKSRISFWVRDTGEGIARLDRKRIFERFARAANSRRQSEGAGLGLSIVQVIVEAHGGQVFLKNEVGTGARFTIVIPLKRSLEKQSRAERVG